jgi:hypothetical protein
VSGRALAVAAVALSAGALSGCGGGATVDAGGLSSGDRKAADAIFRQLQSTPIPSALVQATAVAAAAPDTCRLRLQSESPRRFRLFIFWTPQPDPDPDVGADVPTYTWLDATLGDQIVESRFRVGHADSSLPRAKVFRSHAGNVLTRPGGSCVLLSNGYLRLLTK